jgi:hypothetical protein
MATSLTGRRLRRRQADTRRLQAETPMRHSLGGAGIRGKTRRSPAGASTPGTIRRSTSRPNRQTGSRYRGHRSAFAISRFKTWVGAAIARVDLRMWRGAAFSGPVEPLGRPLLEALRSVRRTSPVRTAHLATGGCALPCLRRTAGKHRAWRPMVHRGRFRRFWTAVTLNGVSAGARYAPPRGFSTLHCAQRVLSGLEHSIHPSSAN